MESLSCWFERRFFPPAESPARPARGPVVITVIGSGGKTSLIWLLAQSQRRRRVLVSPTTRMYPPPPAQHCYDHDRFSGAAFFPEPGIPPPAGISLAGSLSRETGKLESLPPDLLERMIPGYDLVLLEGDGSRNLPLKGWAEYEPVVPPYTTATVAVIPISPLGKQVSPDLVFRIPQFTALCGAAPGDTLRPAHLAAVIAGGPASAPGGGAVRGLFHAARGERVLLINQADNEEQREQARTLAALLPRRVAPDLAAVLAASVALNQAEILRETPALPRTDSAP